ncbi:preprotein translocase subunit YajC [Candidatus Nitrosoglobus terrae]|nr:preprotein translocase subunit YajC [Candidatus Nitrosoglobus terrae]
MTEAWAQSSQPTIGTDVDFWLTLIIFSAFFLIYYVLVIRPRLSRHKERFKMIASLGKGDEIITNGGLLGKVIQMGDSFLLLELADGIEIKVEKNAVSRTVPKGTIKGL